MTYVAILAIIVLRFKKSNCLPKLLDYSLSKLFILIAVNNFKPQ